MNLQVINSKIKILVVSGWYPGIIEPLNGDFIREQVNLLRQEGFKIDIVYVDLNVAYLSKKFWSQRISIRCDKKGNKDYVKSGPFWPKNNAFGFRKWIKAYMSWIKTYIRREGKPDLIHAHTYLGAIVAHFIKREFDIPFLVTEHYTGWLNNAIRKSHRIQGIKAMQDADCITAVSPALKNCLENTLERQIIFLPNFIDTNVFKFQGRNQNPIPVAICIGDLIQRKRVDHAIQAVLTLEELNFSIQLLIIGSGPEEKNLKKMIQNLGLENNVKMMGKKEKHEVATLINASDLLMHPSELETFGLTIAEALCCGVPVVSYNNKGVQAMAQIPGLHICDEQSITSFVGMIREVLSQNPEYEFISETAIGQLGVKGITPQLGKIYQSLLVQDFER